MNPPALTPQDTERLHGQCKRIMENADGVWRNLKEWAEIANGSSEAGVSARLRQVSNEYGYIKEKKNLGRGVWIYRLLPPIPIQTVYQWDGQQASFL